MRSTIRFFLASALFFSGVLPCALAQQPKAITIDAVHVGYQRLGTDYLFKSGCWAPVYVYVTAGPKGAPKAEIVVEADDSDDVRSKFTTPLPPLEPNEAFTLLTYTKPGSASSEITVTAMVDDRPVAVRQEQLISVDLNSQVFLALGGRIPALRRSFASQRPKQPRAAGEEEGSTQDDSDSPRHLALIDDLRLIPNRWFALEPVDVIVLVTGNRDSATGLLGEREGRKEAVADWVRRGGRLIVSVARNQDVVSRLEPIQTLLPITLAGVQQLPKLKGLRVFCNETRGFEAPLQNKSVSIDVAKMEPKAGREIETLSQEPDGPPLIVRGAYGLGSVTVVAFDLDQAPFTTYPQELQAKFWEILSNRTIAAPRSEPGDQQRMRFTGNQGGNDLATQLQVNLEEFEAVPVISFGWVALFILVYILVVGPLDYLFLKKVVKRLELTWITFPTVVITISVAAYFTAYWLKGNDQRINKIDVVDLDVENQRAYGNTWFTIFSPRIQHYTVGLEPVGGNPATSTSNASPSVNMTWMGRPEYGFAGTGRRSRSQGLFHRAYDYTADAAGMVGVPIQVWSTKSFQSRWESAFDPAKPLVTADLRHPKGRHEGITGEITSHLPGELRNVALLHQKGSVLRWYDVDRLLPGVPKRVDNLAREGREMRDWVEDTYGEFGVQRPDGGIQASMVRTQLPVLVKRLMFQQNADPNERNSALRYLDQSWRLGRKDEVIVFGQIKREDGPAEAISQGVGSLSHLWLGSLPGTGQPWQPLLGTLSQEAYVRMIIPVRDADAP
jgi:hypothetical protein